MTDAREKAQVLIRAIGNELELGTLHYNKQGELLTDIESILKCLVDENWVSIQPLPWRACLFHDYGTILQ